ncbi:LPS export ABC transporter permease LptF [Nitrogeniibacter mangrovi]|uniref:Lipopolysaccharide export system permease protein LptF n=1 Tax=Nitrogeniibacter mangrovi TaxID=2016596 RepID=A0A6C1B2T1_9RHOO|nr:LPS export ABC transporter permease LptF [Nitrogeniibacter mangrovi]QID17289.1 LPS export ABC transporter permease LptF [Nitrogeniibacter mangrovi]
MIFLRAAQREFANAAIAVFVALFAILVTTVLIRLLGQAAGGSVPSEAVLALIGFGALAQLPIVLSLTVFIAVLMTLSRVYRDSEMVVWFASGVPLTRWIRPVLRFVLPVVIGIAGVTFVLAPWAQYKSVEYKTRLNNQDDAARVAPGVFRESSGAQRVFFVEVGAGDDGRVKNVFVSTMQDGKLGVMVAEEGFVETRPDGQRFVVLERGRRYEGTPGSPDYGVMHFERYSVRLEAKAVTKLPTRTRMVPTVELLRTPQPDHLGELSSRIGLPLAALILSLLAIPLSYVNPRAGRTNNLIMAILIYLIYSNMISVAQAWITHGKIGFVAGLIAPHALMLTVLLLFFYRRMVVVAPWRRRAAP